jgi:hypothetical protein
MLGDRAVSKSVLEKLKKRGLYKALKSDVIKGAFRHGKEALIDERVLNMGEDEFQKYMDRYGTSLTFSERAALDELRLSFSNYMKSLGDDWLKRFNESITKANKGLQRQLAQKHRANLFLELEKRKALASIAKDMAHITRVQISDAQRVISTETNNAYQDGRVHEILIKSEEEDPLVYKRVWSTACEDCVRAYMEEDKVTPKVFRLSELIANGSNVGKSRKDRLPVVDSLHPHCLCLIYPKLKNFSFDEKGALVHVSKINKASVA